MAGPSIRQSQVNPAFLHSNSTSHKWPFSAVAELIDNAYDPDVRARKLDIDCEPLNSIPCLTFTDNGNGLDAERMHKMLSFGFSNKKDTRTQQAVGQYGNGFKSGSMRLGQDAIVFSSYKKDARTIGLLSQTYLKEIKAETVWVPIISWEVKDEMNLSEEDPSLQAILRHSIFKTKDELLEQFKKIGNNRKGTRIIIYNLKRDDKNRLEFDFMRDENDIIIAEEYATVHPGYDIKGQKDSDIPEHTYSLRAYCRILFMKPRLQIKLRGKLVKTLFMEKSLCQTETDTYKPKNVKLTSDKPVTITFGFNPRKNQYGILFYHKNRLIKPYVKVGYQTKPNYRGVGVVGIVECNFLDPTHNKQDFLDTHVYRTLIRALDVKLNDYWNAKTGTNDDSDGEASNQVNPELADKPDDDWVQCNRCQKWRKLPSNVDIKIYDRIKEWFCEMNPNPDYSDCKVAEETEESDEVGPSYEKTNKSKDKRKRQEPSGDSDDAGPSHKKTNNSNQQGQLRKALQTNQHIHGHVIPQTSSALSTPVKMELPSVSHSPKMSLSSSPRTPLKRFKFSTGESDSIKQELESIKRERDMLLKDKADLESAEKHIKVQADRENHMKVQLDETLRDKEELSQEVQKTSKALKDAEDKKDEALNALKATKQKHADQLKQVEVARKLRLILQEDKQKEIESLKRERVILMNKKADLERSVNEFTKTRAQFDHKYREACERAASAENQLKVQVERQNYMRLQLDETLRDKEELSQKVQKTKDEAVNALKATKQKHADQLKQMEGVRNRQSILLQECKQKLKVMAGLEEWKEKTSKELKEAKDKKDEAVKALEAAKQKHAGQLMQVESDQSRRLIWLEESRQQLKDKQQDLTRRLNASEKTIEEKNAELQAIRQQLNKDKQQDLTGELAACKKHLEKKNAELQTVRQQLNKANSSQANSQALLSNLRTKVFVVLGKMFEHVDLDSMVTDPQSSQVDDVVQEVLNDNTDAIEDTITDISSLEGSIEDGQKEQSLTESLSSASARADGRHTTPPGRADSGSASACSISGSFSSSKHLASFKDSGYAESASIGVTGSATFEDRSTSTQVTAPAIRLKHCQEKSANLNHSRGLLEVSGTGVSLDVPEGAIPDGQTIHVTLSVHWGEDHPPLKGNQLIMGPTIQCRCHPEDFRFQKPVKLTFPHSGQNISMKNVTIWTKDSQQDGKWRVFFNGAKGANVAVKVTENKIKIRVTHFTWYTSVLSYFVGNPKLKLQVMPYIYFSSSDHLVHAFLTIYVVRGDQCQYVEEQERVTGGYQCAVITPVQVSPNGEGVTFTVNNLDMEWHSKFDNKEIPYHLIQVGEVNSLCTFYFKKTVHVAPITGLIDASQKDMRLIQGLRFASARSEQREVAATTRASDADFSDLIHELRPHELPQLYQALSISRPDVERAENLADTADVELRAMNVLLQWRQNNGENATRGELLSALLSSNMLETRDRMMERWRE